MSFFTAFILPLRAQPLTIPFKPNSVCLAAIGDMGLGNNAEDKVARQMSAYHQVLSFDFFIMPGDDIYGGHAPSDFEQKFAAPFDPLLNAGVRFYASLRNHDNIAVERFYKPFNMNGQRYDTCKKGN